MTTITPTHIVQLLEYAACELEIMAECGRHAELIPRGVDVKERVSRINAALERASYHQRRIAMNEAISTAARIWDVGPSELSRYPEAVAGQARAACILAMTREGVAPRFALARRFCISVGSLDKAIERAKVLMESQDFRARYYLLTQMIFSGDGATQEPVI